MEAYQKNFVLSLLAYAAQKDISPATLSAQSGLSLDDVKGNGAATITPEQFDFLWRTSGELTNDPLFGLHFGESLQLAALGIVGQIIQTSKTIGEALTHASQLIHLITDLFTMTVNRSSTTFYVQFVPTGNHEAAYPYAFRHMMDLCFVFVLHEVDGLVLEKIKPIFVKFSHDIHGPAEEYARVLRCKPETNTGEYSIAFDKRYWEEPIITANHALQGVLLEKATAMRNAFDDKQTLKDKLMHFLVANAYLGVPSLEEIAANFNTTTRSLQRRLQDEGTTYQQIADTIRKSLALHYLESGNYQVKEISYILGYNELSAFTRAFKRWTGTNPGSYQKSRAVSQRGHA